MVEEWGLEEWWLAEVPKEPPKQHDLESFWSPVKPKKDLLGSCSFTWIRPNGSVKSRLDRFLVSEQWLSLWPDSCQHVLQRYFSDHCPIILQTKMVDWDPKPFRVVDWWLHQKGYQRMVREAWSRDQQRGWGELC